MSEPRNHHLMIVGYGVLGGMILDQLATLGLPCRITVVGRKADTLRSRVNTAIAVASLHGHAGDFHWRACDVLDVDGVGTLIESERPDVLLNTGCLLPWFEVEHLGSGGVRFADAGRASLAPVDAIIPYRLMQAVARGRHRPIVVNASYPDVVHPALAGIGLAPDVGTGNVANAVPMLRHAAAALLDASPGRVDIRFATHHAVSHRIAHPGLSPADREAYVLRIGLDGSDVTGKLDVDALFDLAATRFRRFMGPAGQSVTAAASIGIVRALMGQRGAHLHAPGPGGLPGGYPIVVENGLIRLADDLGFDRSRAVAANMTAQTIDGIRSISANGDIVFMEKTRDALRSLIGLDIPSFNIAECAQHGFDMLDRVRRLRSRSEHNQKNT